MALDCACAMVYLHRFSISHLLLYHIFKSNFALRLLFRSASPPILHRDLKAENLLVDSNWTVKV